MTDKNVVSYTAETFALQIRKNWAASWRVPLHGRTPERVSLAIAVLR